MNQLIKQYFKFMPLLNTMHISWLDNNNFYLYRCRNYINKYICILCYFYKDTNGNMPQDILQDLSQNVSNNQCQLYSLDNILIGYNMWKDVIVLTTYSEAFDCEEYGIILTVYRDNKYIQFQYLYNTIQCIITDIRGNLIDITSCYIFDLEQLLKDLEDKHSLHLQQPLIQLESMIAIHKL